MSEDLPQRRSSGPSRSPFPVSLTTALQWLALAVGIGFRLRQYLHARPLWLDEAMLTNNILARSYTSLLQPLGSDQTAPVPFLWAVKLSAKLLGTGELALRLIPFMCGVLLLALLLPFVRRLLPPREATLALWIAAVSPALIYYGNELKPYGIDALWSVVLGLLTLRVIDAPTIVRRWWALFAAGALAAVSLAPAPFVLAGVGLALISSPAVRAAPPTRRWLPAMCVSWGALFGVTYLVVYRAAADSVYMQRFWIPYFLSPTLPHLPAKLYNAVSTSSQAFFAAEGGLWRVWASCLLLIPIVFGGVKLWRRGDVARLLLLIAPLLLAVLASTIRRYPVSPRLLLFALPGLTILLASGIGVAAGALERRVRLPWFAAVTLVLLFLPLLDAGRTVLEPLERESVRSPIQQFIREHQAGATVYLFGRTVPAWVFYTTDWRAPDLERVETLEALVSSTGRAFRHASSRGHPVSQEGDDLAYHYRDWTELIGASTGMGPDSTGESQPTPDEGWPENEAARIRRAGGPESWVIFSSFVPGVPVLLDSALTALGGTRTLQVETTGAVAARWVFPDSLRGR